MWYTENIIVGELYPYRECLRKKKNELDRIKQARESLFKTIAIGGRNRIQPLWNKRQESWVCFFFCFFFFFWLEVVDFIFFNLILFFNFTILYWFCHISKWIRHRYTQVYMCSPSWPRGMVWAGEFLSTEVRRWKSLGRC